jgi:hypothetical protein
MTRVSREIGLDVERLVGWLRTRRRRVSRLIPLYPGTP